MSWERVVDVGLAVALVFAFGVSAAAMDSAVTTDPSEVISLDTNLLPIGSDQFGELKREVVEPTDSPSDTGDRERRRSGSGESDRRVEQEQVGAGDATVQSGGGSDSQTGTTSEIDWLQWLLRHLFLLVLLLLGVVGAVVTGILAGRNRERLRELLAALLARLGLGSAAETDDDSVASSRPDCPNEVVRAWYDTVCCLGLDGERSKTPDECAAAAVDAGCDPEVVRSLTAAFQCVRYGGYPVTDDLVAQARTAAARIRKQYQQSPHVQQRQRAQES